MLTALSNGVGKKQGLPKEQKNVLGAERRTNRLIQPLNVLDDARGQSKHPLPNGGNAEIRNQGRTNAGGRAPPCGQRNEKNVITNTGGPGVSNKTRKKHSKSRKKTSEHQSPATQNGIKQIPIHQPREGKGQGVQPIREMSKCQQQGC